MMRLRSGRRAAAAALLALVDRRDGSMRRQGCAIGRRVRHPVGHRSARSPSRRLAPASAPAITAAGRGSAGVVEAVPEPDPRLLDGLSG